MGQPKLSRWGLFTERLSTVLLTAEPGVYARGCQPAGCRHVPAKPCDVSHRQPALSCLGTIRCTATLCIPSAQLLEAPVSGQRAVVSHNPCHDRSSPSTSGVIAAEDVRLVLDRRTGGEHGAHSYVRNWSVPPVRSLVCSKPSF